MKLTHGEMLAATLAGGIQQTRNVARGRRDAHGFEGDGWAAQINGIGAEIAVARALDCYYNPFRPFSERADGDVGRCHVRSSERGPSLILHDTDPPGTWFLVLGCLPDYRIIGTFAKGVTVDRRWWRDDPGVRNPAYFVPQDALRPFGDATADAQTVEEFPW